MKFGITNEPGIIDYQHNYFKDNLNNNRWIRSNEWRVLSSAILKDEKDIRKVSEITEVPSRLIVSILIVEQLRLFNSEREIFKEVFSPLRILGNQNQFSLGVMGIKQETAREIESNLKDKESVWYLGKENENILDFESNNHDKERFERLTDENKRYYSYLYGAIFIKQIEKQWAKYGFGISNNPGIIATIYNIGFRNSKPKDNPILGGAEIDINEEKWSFGSLAESFYNSDELIKEFPK